LINSRSINDLHPHVKALAEKHIELCKREGITIIITSTLRDDAYQATLYAQGRTKPGPIVTNLKVTGAHGFGLAYDVVPITAEGKAEWNNHNWWATIGRIGKILGLEWGGDWKSFIDKPHFQKVEGLTTNELRSGKRPTFWSEAEKAPPTNTPAWKLTALKELHGAGIISDYDGWVKRIDEPLPAWATFIIMNNIRKGVNDESK
jgi:peptidoglycan L-alanyl-D-glutamate endopeptidase CwlK